MIVIGRMAEKFGMLPHQVEQTATTYDYMIMDVLATYDEYQQAKSKSKTLDPSIYKLKQEELQQLLRSSRE